MASEIDRDGNPLTLPFDPDQVACVRMRQAEIARLFEVTPAAVSQWVKKGKITTFADGTIDPNRAARELARNCDISRLRAKPFRPLRQEVEDLRQRLRDLREERDQAIKQQAQMAEQLQAALALAGEQAAWLEGFAALLADAPALELGMDAEEWQALVDEQFDAAGHVAMSRTAAANIETAQAMLRAARAAPVTSGCPPSGETGEGDAET